MCKINNYIIELKKLNTNSRVGRCFYFYGTYEEAIRFATENFNAFNNVFAQYCCITNVETGEEFKF